MYLLGDVAFQYSTQNTGRYNISGKDKTISTHHRLCAVSLLSVGSVNQSDMQGNMSFDVLLLE